MSRAATIRADSGWTLVTAKRPARPSGEKGAAKPCRLLNASWLQFAHKYHKGYCLGPSSTN